jgi:hypothetical protein
VAQGSSGVTPDGARVPPPETCDERADAERELYRLAFAQRDFKLAHGLADALLHSDALNRADEEGELALLAIIYTRPFTRQGVGRLGEEWETFDHNHRHSAVHRFLKTHRHREYAHTDITPLKSAWVSPPGARTDEGFVTTGRPIPVAKETLQEIRALCEHQHGRVKSRIRELLLSLYGDKEWAEGTIFELQHPDRPDIRTIRVP